MKVMTHLQIRCAFVFCSFLKRKLPYIETKVKYKGKRMRNAQWTKSKNENKRKQRKIQNEVILLLFMLVILSSGWEVNNVCGFSFQICSVFVHQWSRCPGMLVLFLFHHLLQWFIFYFFIFFTRRRDSSSTLAVLSLLLQQLG